MPSRKPSRGVRNNNPGNIERGTTKWQGMAKDQSGDPRFIVFTAPVWGVRALAKTLLTYYNTHKLDTVEEIIHRWAPPGENDTGAYVRAVADACGVRPDEKVDVDSIAIMLPLVRAIIRHENGYDPYGEEVLREGIRKAGVADAPPKPLVKQTPVWTQAGAGIAACGAAVGTYAEPVKKVADQLGPYAAAPVIERLVTVLITASGVLALVGILSMALKQKMER